MNHGRRVNKNTLCSPTVHETKKIVIIIRVGKGSIFLFGYLTTRRRNHLLGLSSLSEPILESACHSLHVTHTSGAGCTTALSLLTPIVLSHLTTGVPTRRTQTLLQMVRDLSTSTATCVGLVMSLTEGGRSLRLLCGW